jgi:signal transduction histidine kinase
MAARIQEDARLLAQRWFERLTALLALRPEDVFPSRELLDHVPEVIHEIGKFIATPSNEIGANTFVLIKARELGELRDAQHVSVHQLLREYEVLRGILETFALEQARTLGLTPDMTAVMTYVRRINQTIGLLTQTTVDTFVKRYSTAVEERMRRNEGFNRMISHELRQPLGVLQTAVAQLRALPHGNSESDRARLLATADRNVARLVELTASITRISGMLPDADAQPGTQRISLATAVREAARQLRDLADERAVAVRIEHGLPEVIVDVGQLELLLVNVLSNAIKYSDPSKAERYIDVCAVESNEAECVLEIRDNGVGMSERQLRRAFAPFYRGHADRDQELGAHGLGLGMSIVRDCAEAIGATLNIESVPGDGTALRIAVPCRPVAK